MWSPETTIKTGRNRKALRLGKFKKTLWDYFLLFLEIPVQ